MILSGPGRNGKSSRDFRQISLLATVPAILLAAPLVGLFFGRWLDSKWETEPYLMIAGVVLGFASAGREIYRMVMKSSAMEKKQDDKSES